MTPLEKFGEFMISSLRDKALLQNTMLLDGQLRGRAIQFLQKRVQSLPAEQKEIIRQIVIDAVDTALHDLLFAFQDSHDRNLGIEVFVEGANVAELSGMLHGEPLGEKGWIKRFSSFP
jgi:hypothetical protein